MAVCDGLTDVSTEARRLAAVASVLGAAFSIDDAGEVLGEPVGRLLPWIAEIVDAGIVVAEAEAFAFIDDATREAIYARIPERERLPLHRQIGSFLLARGGSAIPAAAHLASAARFGDQAALKGLDRAATEALSSSPDRAADFALCALDLTPLGDECHPVRMVAAVNALVAARRLLDAATLAHAALDGTAMPPVAAAHLRVTLSSLLIQTARAGEAVSTAQAVLDTVGLPAESYAAAEVARLRALIAQGDPSAARQHAEAILAGDARHGGDDTLAAAFAALSSIAWHEGRVADALGFMRAAVQRADRAPVESSMWNARLCLAPMLTAIGEVEDASACIELAERDAESCRETPWEIMSAVIRARLQVALGDLERAQAGATRALDAAEMLGARSFVVPILLTLADVAVSRGELDAASDHLAKIHADEHVGGLLAQGSYAWIAARLCEQRDGAGRALEMLLPVFDDVCAHKRLFLEAPGAAPSLVRIALAGGDRWRASAVVAGIEQLAAENRQFPPIKVCAVHARALLDGDVAALRRAADSHSQPWARALAAEDAACMLALAGRHEEASDELARACDAYDRAGARGDAERVRRRMEMPTARAGHTGRRDRPVEGWDSLTEGERRVVVLVAKGLTNRQVAAQAFLSRHTVDFHLRQVFRKLSVSSRVELARVAIEHERAEP
ncbi:MAG TPA: LuxR C-terminal-related transcriptional regulator [Acidimicrobiia bacterium]|nr:LuxR C-terminal-related transcriptional regulator [Acidimicrobiia bacterium]